MVSAPPRFVTACNTQLIGTNLQQYPAIKNAPLPADAAGSDTFNNYVLFSLLLIVPWYFSYKVGGGLKTTIPFLMGLWTIASSVSPSNNEKARYPGKPIEHYLEFHRDSDKAKYHGNSKIPMETFHELYFDGHVSFKGDALEVMEYRHDWASFRFTLSLFWIFLTGMIPEVIMHTR